MDLLPLNLFVVPPLAGSTSSRLKAELRTTPALALAPAPAGGRRAHDQTRARHLTPFQINHWPNRYPQLRLATRRDRQDDAGIGPMALRGQPVGFAVFRSLVEPARVRRYQAI